MAWCNRPDSGALVHVLGHFPGAFDGIDQAGAFTEQPVSTFPKSGFFAASEPRAFSRGPRRVTGLFTIAREADFAHRALS